jgi:hypothetical protein
MPAAARPLLPLWLSINLSFISPSPPRAHPPPPLATLGRPWPSLAILGLPWPPLAGRKKRAAPQRLSTLLRSATPDPTHRPHSVPSGRARVRARTRSRTEASSPPSPAHFIAATMFRFHLTAQAFSSDCRHYSSGMQDSRPRSNYLFGLPILFLSAVARAQTRTHTKAQRHKPRAGITSTCYALRTRALNFFD